MDNQNQNSHNQGSNRQSQQLRYQRNAANNHVFNTVETTRTHHGEGYPTQRQALESNDHVKKQEADDEPEFIITHRENTVDKFLKATDAPQYKNVTEQEQRRKKTPRDIFDGVKRLKIWG